ncbi:cytochrome P450 [Infundibulicybe gibba]|nr:cytochrome P450 [Infundibulicybe gibba]
MLDTSTFISLLSSVILLFFVRKIAAFWQAIRSIRNHPAYRTIFYQANNGIGNRTFANKHKVYSKVGWDIYGAISLWPQATTSLTLADASAIKEVTSSRARFPKPIEKYDAILFFGRNIVGSEGDEWKKYRKISAPAFSERNNKLVWDETVKIVNGLFDNTILKMFINRSQIALFVIGAAGFGRPISWEEDSIVPPGHKLSFKDALHTVSINVMTKLKIPDWAMGMTPCLRGIRLAFSELQLYMSEMIRDRQTSEKVERFDLFSSLLDANIEDEATVALIESELIGISLFSPTPFNLSINEPTGNIFMFLLAGHETTAHTLGFTLGMLALYQDEQEWLYQHIKSVIPDGRIPKYKEMQLFTCSMAALYETLRMFPPAVSVPKYSTEDTVLVAGNQHGEQQTIPVPKGTNIAIDASGLHYNPRYWEDPHAFRPSRFLGDWLRDAFMPFSAGARACLGRRFFETEGVAALTMFVSKYKISVKEEPQFENETFEARKERILAIKPGRITLTPTRVPLVFTRRDCS